MMTVRDVMSHKVVSVVARTPLPDVARLLVEHRISGLPVVDEQGTVLGVVSEADFLVKEQGPEAAQRGPFARFLPGSKASRRRLAKLAATTAGEAMTSPAVTIEPYRSISEAATRMASLSINRLPVVDGGRLVGIVTRADLVRAYTRTDEELERTIREEVLLRSLWLDPAGFKVGVSDGVVSIAGGVERRSTAEMVERVVAMVPGVVAVDLEISWTVDDSRARPAAIDPFFPHSPG
jgi:CBS domain-containing protein